MPTAEEQNEPRPSRIEVVADVKAFMKTLDEVEVKAGEHVISKNSVSAFVRKSPVDQDWAGWDYLRQLQQYCRDNAVAKGFGKEGDDMRDLAADLRVKGQDTLADQVLANYFSKRINLIHDELAEAHEELRNGKLPDEEYTNQTPGKEGKPEGIPSELADILIRDLDVSGEYEVDLADVIWGKLRYNATRDAMHGRRF